MSALDPTPSIRLHISPFTPSLLNSYIPPSLLPSASGISYHTIESFPETPYGYIELPAMEAQKLKKKLNGSTLKGSKIRIEDARPDKRKSVAATSAADEQVVQEKPRKKARKARRDEGELDGVELPEGRKVKRGWTETVAEKRQDKESNKKGRTEKKDKKDGKRKREVSKYTTEPECLFRTELPPGVTLAADDAKKEKKHKKRSNKHVLVHEFANTTKHASFLKSGTVDKGAKVAHEFVEGKGWVDEDGNLIEEETEIQRAKRLRRELIEAGKAAKESLENMNSTERQAAAKDTTSQPKDKTSIPKNSKKAATPEPESSSESASSSEPSSGSGSESDSDSGATSNSSSPSHTSRKATSPDNASNKEIHPLEALFKRAPPTTIPISQNSPLKPPPITTSFNFFSSDLEEPEEPNEDVEMSGLNIPQTPFTRQDLEWRSTRSAAPTPDTAAVNKKFSFSMATNDEEDEEEEGEEEEERYKAEDFTVAPAVNGVGPSKAEGEGQEAGKNESEFAKWFWENRGDNNRAWKKRRREAMKVRRKRENRRLTRRVV